MNEKTEIERAFKAVETENENLHICLHDIIETRKLLEANLDAVDNQLSSVVSGVSDLQSINAIKAYKIQTLEQEANQLEEKQLSFKESILNLDRKMEEKKASLSLKISNFKRETENLCELYLSAVHKEIAEAECLKIMDDIHELKLEYSEKENVLLKIKKELEDFVFYEMPGSGMEHLVSLEERQLVMDFLEHQLINARKQKQNLKNAKAEKQVEEFDWSRRC